MYVCTYIDKAEDHNNKSISLASSTGGGHLVGDDGVSWRARALKRAKEEAGRTGKKLEEVGR